MSTHLATDPDTSHGVNTDPLWYYAANLHAPHLQKSRKRDWIEGFVSAMALLAEGSDDSECLLETVCGETSII